MQRQQRIENVCSRLNESHKIKWGTFFISDQRKYSYCATPKVACSSWKLTLLRLTGKDVSHINDVYFGAITDRVLKRGIHYNATERESRLKKYFKFMFVREPLGTTGVGIQGQMLSWSKRAKTVCRCAQDASSIGKQYRPRWDNKTVLHVQGGSKKVSCWHSTTAYFFWATLYINVVWQMNWQIAL